MAKSVKDQIIKEVERLDAPRQREVLEFARGLNGAARATGQDLARFAGCMELADLRSMSQSIEEGCEVIEPNAW
ncbi:MAG TPA: hypothetical protein VJN93_14380 [Candidatus Acidoferrum sp.]|nr:hypothetical protein [Candidatus Acidoferrum sp.]